MAKRISVVVPYYKRLLNMRLVLDALAEQDLPREAFEVVIGSLEHSVDLLSCVEQHAARLDVRCVMAAEPWNVARARNLALRAAEGEVLLLLDADILLPRGFLRRLWEHFARGESHVVVGQMLNYDEGKDVGSYAAHDYSYYRDRYLFAQCREGLGQDIRWTIERPIPWALAWTAVVALPRAQLEQSQLYFDTRFKGWGVEDTEWAYRLHRARLPFLFADDLWAIHLPHPRDVTQNHQDEARNFDRFYHKWPCFEVEIVAAFGDVNGNLRYHEIMQQAHNVRGEATQFGVVEFVADAQRALAVGALCDSAGSIVNGQLLDALKDASDIKVLPILGVKLPYENSTVARVHVLPPLRQAPATLQQMVQREAERVAGRNVLVH